MLQANPWTSVALAVLFLSQRKRVSEPILRRLEMSTRLGRLFLSSSRMSFLLVLACAMWVARNGWLIIKLARMWRTSVRRLRLGKLPEFNNVAWSSLAAMVMGCSYFSQVCVARLTYLPGGICESLLEECGDLSKRFYPFPFWSWGFYGGLLQTGLSQVVLPLLFSRPSYGRRQLITAADGGTIALDWFELNEQAEGASFINGSNKKSGDGGKKQATVVIFPGYLGCSDEWYLNRLVSRLVNHFGRVCVYVRRGGGADNKQHQLLLTSPHVQTIGDDKDWQLALQNILAVTKDTPLLGVGFSLGGHNMLRQLGLAGASSPFVACVTLGAPVCLVAVSYYLLYRARSMDWVFRGKLKDLLLSNAKVFHKAGIDIETMIKNCASFRDLFSHTHVPLLGYEDLETYFYLTSAKRQLRGIRIPTLCLHACDDPVVPLHSFDDDEGAVIHRPFQYNPYLCLATTVTGGHHAWLGINPFRSYAENVAVQWLDVCFNRSRTAGLSRTESCTFPKLLPSRPPSTRD